MCCHAMPRRDFLSISLGAAALPAFAAPGWARDLWNPERPLTAIGKPLQVQPILIYATPAPKEKSSWKSWGGVQTDAAAATEARHIDEELKTLSGQAEFGLQPLPAIKVKTPEEAARARAAVPAGAVTIVYPATGSGAALRAAIGETGETIIFARHRSGPIYYWYEALSTRYLRKQNQPPAPGAPRLSVNDVVIDEMPELLWRLRALAAVNNFVGTKIVALGGAAGKYAGSAPKTARDKWKFDIAEVSYDDLTRRVNSARNDKARMALAADWAKRYLALPGTVLDTEQKYVVNAFMLYGVLTDMMREHGASAFTIQSCMGTIMPISDTTACLTLGIMNDEGLIAFCESDFVVIPAGIFMRHVAARPIFMHNSTFPHGGLVTCAHCTGPRRMDGNRYDPVRVVTHYESEFGAAPKVEMPIGQAVTMISPEYDTCRWVGIQGTVEANPFYEICRSQQEVRVHGEWRKLLDEVRDSHWMMAYGDWLRELHYAAPRIGVQWDSVS
jgi:hypothetical protein